MTSIWMGSCNLPHFQPLQGNIKTDVLIVGGGMAGILCAYFLQDAGIDYALVERNRICSGITKDTTAKITAQHGLIYQKLLRSLGTEKTKMYFDANQKAVKKYSELCQTIDCDYEEKTSYVYSTESRRKLEKEAEALNQVGYPAVLTETAKLPFHTEGAIGFQGQAQFHPLKFIAHIAESLSVYEHTFVKELKDQTAITDSGSIAFQKLIFTTHFPMDNKHGLYFLKMYQNRSYVIALPHAPKIDGMYIDENKKGYSFRNYKDFLLIGGGGHRTGKCGGKWEELRNFAKSQYPDLDVEYHWAAQDCMTLDGVPYIGRYSKKSRDCFVATGFQKWGMSSSMAAAMILRDMVLGRENPYAEVFYPSRSMGKPQLFVNAWEAMKNFLIPTKKRCPHLGCSLKWNDTEESWDCPCHGSRFDNKGNLIDNPANGNLKR